MRPARWFTVCCAAWLCAACVSQPRITGGAASGGAAELPSWQADGRVGISGVEQAGSGSFRWTQRAASSAVQFSGPLGAGALQITIDDARLTLRASDGSQYDADQVVTELQARLGVAVPVAQLRFWLVGLAAPGHHQWLQEGAVLEQDGWRIAYDEWRQRDRLRLPGKLVLTQRQLRIVLVIQQWQVGF